MAKRWPGGVHTTVGLFEVDIRRLTRPLGALY